MNLLKLLLFSIIFLIPLLGANSNFGYEQIKIVFFIFSISLVGFIWILGKPKLSWDLIKIVSVIFIFLLFVSSLSGIDFRLSFLGGEPYFQGFIIYAYLGLFSVMVASSRIDLQKFALALVVSASLVSIAAIRQWLASDIFHLPVSNYAGRVISTFGQPNFYAGFLLLTLPFSYYLLVIPRERSDRGNLLGPWKIATLIVRDDALRVLGWVSGLLSLIGIFISFSRSAILLALLLLLLGLIDQLRIKLQTGLVVLGIIILSIFIALKFSSGIVGNEIANPFFTKNPDLTRESVEKRIYIWPEAIKVGLQKPFTGYGLENIGRAFADYFEVNKHSLFEENLNIRPVLISLKELNIDRSHNYLLDLLLFSGGLGLLGWLGLVGVLWWKLKNTKYSTAVDKSVLMVALATYVIWVQFQNQSIVHLIYFWLLVGLINREA